MANVAPPGVDSAGPHLHDVVREEFAVTAFFPHALAPFVAIPAALVVPTVAVVEKLLRLGALVELAQTSPPFFEDVLSSWGLFLGARMGRRSQ